MIWVQIRVFLRKVILGICYQPPSYGSSFVDELRDALNIIVVRFPVVPVILVGDFNYPSIVWSNSSAYPSLFSTECSNFLHMCAYLNLS
uniref:Putative secreted protein n=1 Tax=Amblyomma triste TaxID=251400 RepID=A0A023G1I2_AMBTT